MATPKWEQQQYREEGYQMCARYVLQLGNNLLVLVTPQAPQMGTNTPWMAELVTSLQYGVYSEQILVQENYATAEQAMEQFSKYLGGVFELARSSLGQESPLVTSVATQMFLQKDLRPETAWRLAREFVAKGNE